MNKLLLDQLIKLDNKFKYVVDGDNSKSILGDFSEVVFKKVGGRTDMIKVVFEDYFINPFEGFDFHERFHNKTPPYAKTMYGVIEKETDKMYYFKVHSDTSDEIWQGYCPKKSCKIYNF